MLNDKQYTLDVEIEAQTLSELLSKIESSDGVERYKLSATYRVFIAWNKLIQNSLYKSDFECAVRDYLIVNNTSIKVPGYIPSAYADKFGLIFNEIEQTLSASHCYPKYANHTFINASFMQGFQLKANEQKVNLETNSFIRKLSGFSTYKSEDQKLAVVGALKAPNGYTTLISMSTGGGKSLVTQAVAYQKDGLTVVIVPTVSLMLDQVRNIKGKKENEVLYYNSSSNNLTQIEYAIKSRVARLLYISPEALIRNPKLHSLIFEANKDQYLINLVIDEAHMVMEWGALFRVDFQCLDIIRKQLLVNNPSLRTYLLSATFSEEAVHLLKLTYSENDKWLEIRCDKLRKEPRFSFIKTDAYEKLNKTVELICTLPHPMIVYVQTPAQAESLKNELRERVGLWNVRTFTGRTSSSDRSRLIDEWTSNEFSIMIATCAFGVGVDKKDVRTVLHLYVPANANNYYQEAGRGGRDGLPCLSVILYSNEDILDAFNYIQKVLTTEKLSARWFSMLGKAKFKGSGKYIVDTTIKPDYRDQPEDTFEFWPNDGDVNWNVYVILFLKRYGYLTVDSMQYDEKNKFLFDITLLNSQLRNNDDTAKSILDDCRQKEYLRNRESLDQLNDALRNAQRQCVSTLFNQVYSKTSEYCAGCDGHKELHNYQSTRALVSSLNTLVNGTSSKVSGMLGNAKNKLVLADDGVEGIINLLSSIGINAFVGPLNLKYFSLNSHFDDTTIAFEYEEFFRCADNGRMFLAGCVGVVLPEDNSDLIMRLLSVCKQLSLRYGISFVFVSKTNTYLVKKDKMLSELIEGPCVQGYVFEEECRNV